MALFLGLRVPNFLTGTFMGSPLTLAPGQPAESMPCSPQPLQHHCLMVTLHRVPAVPSRLQGGTYLGSYSCPGFSLWIFFTSFLIIPQVV